MAGRPCGTIGRVRSGPVLRSPPGDRKNGHAPSADYTDSEIKSAQIGEICGSVMLAVSNYVQIRMVWGGKCKKSGCLGLDLPGGKRVESCFIGRFASGRNVLPRSATSKPAGWSSGDRKIRIPKLETNSKHKARMTKTSCRQSLAVWNIASFEH